MHKTLLALAGFASVLAIPAQATEASEPVTVTVSMADLDLSLAADRDRLERRMDNAVRRACDTRGLGADARRLEAACRADMLQALAPQVELAVAAANARQFAAAYLEPDA